MAAHRSRFSSSSPAGKSVAQKLLQVFVIVFVHRVTPICSSFLRSRRVARKSLDFTVPIEISSAEAISR